MRPLLDRFILGFPVLFLKQYPYAWIAIVALWPRSPLVASLFIGVVILGVLSLRWQSVAWISHMRRQHAGETGKFYVDQPPIAWQNTLPNFAVVFALSIVAALILRGQFGLTFWQLLVMATGFTVLYRDTRFFGSAVTYVITATGIGIRLVPGHIDYRLFLPFKEISRIERKDYQQSSDTDLFARTSTARDGLLIIPKDPRGFTARIDKLFIVPKDIDRFVEQLPYGYGKAV